MCAFCRCPLNASRTVERAGWATLLAIIRVDPVAGLVDLLSTTGCIHDIITAHVTVVVPGGCTFVRGSDYDSRSRDRQNRTVVCVQQCITSQRRLVVVMQAVSVVVVVHTVTSGVIVTVVEVIVIFIQVVISFSVLSVVCILVVVVGRGQGAFRSSHAEQATHGPREDAGVLGYQAWQHHDGNNGIQTHKSHPTVVVETAT
jgi:hypothetical protein